MSIEKFTGSFSTEESGCVILVNKTIQSITNLNAAGVYAYLSTKPPTWIINPTEIRRHFGIGRDKVYSSLNALMDLKLLSRTDIRHNGQFTCFEYKLHLRPYAGTRFSPFPDLPDTVLPDTVNQDAYITKILENKDNILTTSHQDVKTKPKSKDDPIYREVVDAYHETMPDRPKVRVISKEYRDLIDSMIKNWTGYQKNKDNFSIANFKNYLLFIEQRCTWIFNERVFDSGRTEYNKLKMLISERTISRVANGEYYDK